MKNIIQSIFFLTTLLLVISCSNILQENENKVPMVTSVTIDGTLKNGATLTGQYTYIDEEGDIEYGTTFRWLRYNDSNGLTGETVLGTYQSYTITTDDISKYLKFEVTPASSSGTSPGLSVQSALSAAIIESATVVKVDVTIKTGIKIYRGETPEQLTTKFDAVATYSDGSKKAITLTKEMITKFDTGTVGIKTFEFTVEGIVISLNNIEVLTATLKDFVIISPSKTTYLAGEHINLEGMKIIARYYNGTERDVTNDAILVPNINSALETSHNKIKISYDLKETSFPITVNETPFTFGYNVINGIKYYGVDSYRKPSGVTSVKIPATFDGKAIERIGGVAFYNKGLLNIEIPSTVKIIEDGFHRGGGQYQGAFESNQLTNVIIPSSVTYIGCNAFKNNTLINIVIPNSVKSIGKQAFRSNKLSSVTIPNSVTTIEVDAFRYNQLTSITIPNSVTTIGSYAFDSNQLTSVTIPNTITIINDGVFWHNQLTSITIPDSVKTIGGSAFASNKLISISIPPSVTTIGVYAFESNQLTSLTIPSTVTTIKDGAFLGNSLISVTIPNTITTIEKSVFSSNNLTSITIPNSVKTIGDSAFASNYLTEVEIPNSVTTIGKNAFGHNDLTSINIPDSVKTIGDSVFVYNQLTSATIPNSISAIGDWAFASNKLTSITIPASVKSIGKRAFQENQLTNITIPNSVTTIGEFAFEKNKLTSVSIADSVTTIDVGAFRFNQLTSVTIPNSVKLIQDWAFGYNKLTNVIINMTTGNIKFFSFTDNSTLIGKTIKVNPTVTLDPRAFDDGVILVRE